jgi:GTP-binding protein YchF
MALSIGIVGLPNVGKSTLFNALTRQQNAEAANYPFCTIEPNKATVAVPDSRVDQLAELVKPESVVHATVDFVDIAGLVKGASRGEGLGNKFLANIREADAVLHVVRCFEDGDVVHVEGSVDPVRDVDIIETELILADLQSMEKRIDRLTRLARSDKEVRKELEAAAGLQAHLEEGSPVRSYEAHDADALSPTLSDMQFLTDKRIIYCANVSEDALTEASDTIAALTAYAAEREFEVVVISARMEEELAGLSDDERDEFLSSYGVEESGLDKIIHTGYRALKLLSYFTAGPQEVRAWTIHAGDRAPQAAGVIHTDFERGFIRANVIDFSDYMTRGGEAACKSAGVMRVEGKEYVVKDGDVILFLFNV